ncbi:D-amino acid aminotransferase [Marinobacteraceae bacterium S3BR75-40.1]
MQVWLNGEFMAAEAARISPLDRGFLFGDGVYEVIPVYAGRPFALQAHLDRLDRSLAAIGLQVPENRGDWSRLIDTLVADNGGGDQAVYLQITRGPAPQRDHLFPEQPHPTRFLMSWSLGDKLRQALDVEQGIRAVTLDDNRWLRCDIKATSLLPNALLKQAAQEAGAEEAILVRDGRVTECAAANVFLVEQGHLVTPPADHHILHGITRNWIVALAGREGVTCREEPIARERLLEAEEIWISSSTREIVPVIELDGRHVGNGTPGPVWRRIAESYRQIRNTT